MNGKNNSPTPKRTVTWMYIAMIFIVLALLTNACNLMTIYGSGDIVTKTVEVHGFNRVVFNGSGELMLNQGDEETIAVAADDNLIEQIKVEVRDGTLYISHREMISPSQPIQIRVSVKEITGLELAGIIDAETEFIFAESLKIDLSGVTTLKVKELETETLVVSLNGSNNFELTGTGQVTEQEITLNGSNSYEASKLQSQNVSLSINGSNSATVWAVDTLKIKIAGDGSVQYYGNPQINQSGTGNADLISLGDR